MTAGARGVALVQGASRGLGLQLARALAARGNLDVVATCRNPDKAEELAGIGGVDVLQLDVERPDHVEAAAQHVKAKYGGRLDLLINSAGILHPSGRGETKLDDVNLEALEQLHRVNTFGPLLMAKHFAPMLKKGQAAVGSGKDHCAIFACISARAASFDDNKLGGWYSYRMSKVGLNMATKCLSIELGRGKNKVICLALHPGVLDTDLSRPYHKNMAKDHIMSAEKGAADLLSLLDGATLKDSGKFMDHTGWTIPW